MAGINWDLVGALLFLAGFYPLARAWQANRHTTLRPALAWAACALAAWSAGVGGPALGLPEWAVSMSRYLALCLTGCAGVAVLGARRPGVGAWNFIVAGLLAVLLLPLAEGLGTLKLQAPHLAFLPVTLAAALLNYLPTRLGLAALALAAGCGVELADLANGPLPPEGRVAGWALAAAAPWLALAALRLRPAPASEFDAVWLGFRDRFGFVWGQRLRDQFNRSAANAGWPVALTWAGLRPIGAGSPDPALPLATLRAALKRFGPTLPDESPPDGA